MGKTEEQLGVLGIIRIAKRLNHADECNQLLPGPGNERKELCPSPTSSAPPPAPVPSATRKQTLLTTK